MTAYNPAEVERLIAEAREDDARMVPVPWEWNGRSHRLEGPYKEQPDAEVDDPGIRHCIIETDGGHYPPGATVGAAIARTRNNLAAMADQLEAARAEIERLRARATPTLAERCHEVQHLTSGMESDLWCAVETACGKGNVTPSDDGELRTDGYDNSIEVWGVLDIDLDAAARKLKESGFGKVWLHQHMGRENCKCPSR